MHFCSLFFVEFFAIVCAVYWMLPSDRLRTWLLLGASYYFYATWNRWLAAVVLASSVFDFCAARCIEMDKEGRWRRLVLVMLSVATNLGLLCFFKYVNFFLASLQELFDRCGASASFPLISVLAPIGISFYTFEAISYVVDVYKGRLKAERSLPNFLLFILFFPHLIAGPIVRSRDFLPQIRRTKRWSWLRARLGVRIFLLGLFKKWVIADHMALIVNPVFANPVAYRYTAIWIAVFAYALQIYGDFSGYSDMAISCAHLLGYRLSKNFDMPYLARNVSDFWRRWHISLSSWLRDYLFIPLGGSRGGDWQTARNLLVTMMLGGLWHGASWTFVAWGTVHGLLLILHRYFQRFAARRAAWQATLQSAPGTVGRIVVTFLAVSLCWVFFRAPSFGTALLVFQGLAFHRGYALHNGLWLLIAALAALLVGRALGRNRHFWRFIDRLPAPMVGAAHAFVLSICLVLAPISEKAFIYFQF